MPQKLEGSWGSVYAVIQKHASKLGVKNSEFEERKMNTMIKERASEYANVLSRKRVTQVALGDGDSNYLADNRKERAWLGVTEHACYGRMLSWS